MAVPKKRTGHSAQGKRRSNWKATKPATTTCPTCGATVLAHTVCTSCGSYKGKTVSKKGAVTEVAEAPKAEVVEEKPAKKSAKAKKAEEVKAEVVEETKEEKTEE